MTKDAVGEAVRAQRREERLGPDAACALCGERNSRSLTTVHQSLLEEHHVVARANDAAFTLVVCRNCHAILSEGQYDHQVPRNRPETFLHKLIAVLRALGALFRDLANRFFAWADQLQALLAGLDKRVPSWRKLPQAAL